MSHKAGTKIHKYTEEEFSRIRRGDYLPGIDRRSQRYALERYQARLATGRRNGRREKEPELPVWHGYEYSTGEWV